MYKPKGSNVLVTIDDIEYLLPRWWENRNLGEDTSGYLKKGYRSDILEPLVLKFVSSIYQNR